MLVFFLELVFVDTIHLADFYCPSFFETTDAAGQPPLRTRAFPPGLRHLAPPAHQKVRTDNTILEKNQLVRRTNRLYNRIRRNCS